MPVRIHNASLEEVLLTGLVVDLNGYPGRVRWLIPPVKTEGDLKELIDGMSFGRDSEDVRRWAERHVQMIKRNQRSKRRYDRLWSKQRIEDIRRAVEAGRILEVKNKKRVALNRVVMDPGTAHTFF